MDKFPGMVQPNTCSWRRGVTVTALDELEDEEEEIFEFRSNHKDYLAPALGLAYPLTLDWFAATFPDLLELIKHDITVDFEISKNEPTVFSASHYSLSKNWNLKVKCVKQADVAEIRKKLEEELPPLLRTWFSDTLRDLKLYSLRHLWVACTPTKFEFGDLDEK